MCLCPESSHLVASETGTDFDPRQQDGHRYRSMITVLPGWCVGFVIALLGYKNRPE